MRGSLLVKVNQNIVPRFFVTASTSKATTLKYPEYKQLLLELLRTYSGRIGEHVFVDAVLGWNDRDALHYHLILSTMKPVEPPVCVANRLKPFGHVDVRYFDVSRLLPCLEYMFAKKGLKANHHDHVRDTDVDGLIICPQTHSKCGKRPVQCRHKRRRISWQTHEWSKRYQ